MVKIEFEFEFEPISGTFDLTTFYQDMIKRGAFDAHDYWTFWDPDLGYHMESGLECEFQRPAAYAYLFIQETMYSPESPNLRGISVGLSDGDWSCVKFANNFTEEQYDLLISEVPELVPPREDDEVPRFNPKMPGQGTLSGL